jgi:hypothetical protein
MVNGVQTSVFMPRAKDRDISVPMFLALSSRRRFTA